MNKIFLSILATGFFYSAASGQEQTCPSIELALPPGVTQPEQPATISAKLTNPSNVQKLSYSWTASDGKITSGQGTPVIELFAGEDDEGKNIKITLEITGLPAGCPSVAEDLMPIAQYPIGEPCDEFGTLSPNDIRGRLDSYFACVENNPNAAGFIEIIFGSRDSKARRQSLLNIMVKHIEFRKFPKNRITLGITNDEHPRVVLWTVPPGAKLPKSWSGKGGRITDDTHKIIRAEELSQNTIKTLLDL